MTNVFQEFKHGYIQPLPESRSGNLAKLGLPEAPEFEAGYHRWSQAEIDALTLAWASRRPLLVRGEPGTGKTQLARAVAVAKGWHLHSVTIQPHTEAPDLVAGFDAVRRLGDAQAQRLKEGANEQEYWTPGPLWWAFDWNDAARFKQVSADAATRPSGHVLLIDEIDKADSDLPNSLLELLGQRRLPIPALNRTIGAPAGEMPLVLITTNEDRELPPAFVRRCMVLNLDKPEGMDYADWLVERGTAHHGPKSAQPMDLSVLQRAARQLAKDRRSVEQAGHPPPGPAEYLDLLSALYTLTEKEDDVTRARAMQHDWLEKLSAYAYLKQSGQAAKANPELAQTRKPIPNEADEAGEPE